MKEKFNKIEHLKRQLTFSSEELMNHVCIITTAINKQDNAGQQKHHIKNKLKNNKIAKEIITLLKSNLKLIDSQNLFPKEHEYSLFYFFCQSTSRVRKIV